ncbi:hypothetical protein [Achromobacter kerstersii]|uniref:hypothetical protein n=1 Tax=Achromobacter kerstersii TaxID=1353890 RepID=UPI003D03691E
MDSQTTTIVVEISKEFIGLMQRIDPNWERAYYRFRMDGGRYGSNGSYSLPSGAQLIGALQCSDFYDSANKKGYELFQALKRNKGVFLLTIDSDFNYHVDFDWEDIDRWEITKMNGSSGLPRGI